jgi:RNA-directed DNA polymerase
VERKFLGCSFTLREAKRRIVAKAIVRFKQKVRELTGRTRGISIEQMTKELASYLRGWRSCFGFCETPSVLENLDHWIRRRLRSMIWKQWKRGKVRCAKLCARGVNKHLAAKQPGVLTVRGASRTAPP